jgi:N-acetylglucosamine-6-sulfatase
MKLPIAMPRAFSLFNGTTLTQCSALGLLLLTPALRLDAAEAKPTQPNILFIFSDDHAERLIGAYDGSINKTPNIDRIAHEGALFTRSFNTNSICCPSRASILTGKHSHANGVLGNSSRWNTRQWSYPRDLGKAGYQTALIGKWHIKGNPTDEFQHWEILSGYGGQGSYYNPEFISLAGPSKVTGYEPDITTDKALEWLQKRDTSKPFLLCAQYKAPHTPRTPGPKHLGSYEGVTFPEPPTLFDDYSTRQPFVSKTWMALKGMRGDGLGIGPTREEIAANPERSKELNSLKGLNAEQMDAWHNAYDPRNREYKKLLAEGKLEGNAGISYKYQRYISDSIRCVDGLDENIGRLLTYLDKTGLSKNTIVIYSTDQGFFTGEHGWAEKRWMYEESFRSPLMIRWPGTIKPGTRVDALVQNIDLAPTLLTAAGVPVPKDVHGVPLQPVLGGSTPADWRKDLLYAYYDGGTPESPGEYNMPRMMGVRDDRYKLISYYDYNAWEFYDLQKDPTEVNNTYDAPKNAKEVERLKGRLAALKEQYQVPEPAKLIPRNKKRSNQAAQKNAVNDSDE